MESKSLFLGLLLSFFVCSAASQDTEVLDRGDWEQLKTEIEYNRSGSRSSTNNPDSEGGFREFSFEEEPDDSSAIALGGFVQMVVIILFIAFIVALLYVLLGNVGVLRANPKTESGGFSGELENIEENFSKGNLERWLEYAIKKGDSYLIIRIHFLLILKKLEVQRLITWKKDKTNWSYIEELAGHDYQRPFSQLVVEYDELWYGEKVYSQRDLDLKIDRFDSFKKRVGADE